MSFYYSPFQPPTKKRSDGMPILDFGSNFFFSWSSKRTIVFFNILTRLKSRSKSIRISPQTEYELSFFEICTFCNRNELKEHDNTEPMKIYKAVKQKYHYANKNRIQTNWSN